MIAWIEANTMLATGVALLLSGVLWLIVARLRRRAPPRAYRDVLSDGAGPAQRNMALIDAAPAAAIDPPVVIAPAHGAEPLQTGDDLTRIKGLGPKLSRVLADLGVTSYAQIAAWSDADLAAIDASLGAFAGRPARDAWVEQAQLLIADDTAAYEAKFGKL